MYIMYVDESGDTGIKPGSSEYFILSALIIHEKRWNSFIKSFIDFRRSVNKATGFKVREEIHTQVMINGRIDANKGIDRNKRILILRNTIDWISTQEFVRILNIIVDKKSFTDSKIVFERGWSTLIQRFENTLKNTNFPDCSSSDDQGLIIADNTNGEDLRKLTRKMRSYNPIPSKYQSEPRNIPINRIIEDPVFRDSRHSYFIQIVDVIAYFTGQYIKPNKVIKKQGAKGYFERFESVMCKEASPKDPFGRVWIKK